MSRPGSQAITHSPARWLWPGLIVLGIVVRLVIWWFTIGSNDVGGWASHAMSLQKIGLAETYRTVKLYNHPPLPGLYAQWAYTQCTENDVALFARLLKLPALLGEALVLGALWRLGGARLAGLYSILPAPILISAYHGNTDCLCVAFALLAALAFDRRWYGRAGLALAASLNVKLIPLILVPMFVIAAPSWPALLRLSLALGAGLLVFLPCAIEAPAAMYRNMLAYNSSPDDWGFNALFNAAAAQPALRSAALVAQAVFVATGRYLILGGAVAVAVASRLRLRLSMREQMAIAFGLFLFFAPGFGVQYMVFVVVPLIAVRAGWGVFFGVASGVFIGALYASFLDPKLLWFSRFRTPFPAWIPPFGLIAWLGLGAWLWRYLFAAWRESAAPAATPRADRTPTRPPAPGSRSSSG